MSTQRTPEVIVKNILKKSALSVYLMEKCHGNAINHCFATVFSELILCNVAVAAAVTNENVIIGTACL